MSAMIKIERCDYCSGFIENENFLICQGCRGNVHIKCLLNSSTPGDFIGDIFFDLTCINCVKQQKECEENTSSSPATTGAIKEILVRHHLSWVMVIVLVLYNLGVKSKGLSHHGYFHWQNHIANFIEKNWKYLFVTAPRRRKRWIGTVAGVLSHHSPDFFISGFSEFNQSGWWKLTHSNRTPKYILMLYEQFCHKRQQQRLKKRLPTEALTALVEPKKLRNSADSDEDTFLMGTCSRAIPYMGRKPKVAKKVDIGEEDNRTATQSNLMDFLAETFSNDDLAMLNNLTGNGALSSGGNDIKSEFIPLFDSNEENANSYEENVFSIANENDTGQTTSLERVNNSNNASTSTCSMYRSEINKSINEKDIDDDDEDGDDSENDDEAFKPRIIQVTNFQESKTIRSINYATKKSKMKKEVFSDIEPIDDVHDRQIVTEGDNNSLESETESTTSLQPCKSSLFTKQPRRLWPWLVQNDNSDGIDTSNTQQELDSLVPMSTYEETEMLIKLKRIFALESKHKLTIPSQVRRFYRKLCIREWKRAHGKPIFDLDNYQAQHLRDAKQTHDEKRILDRYQLISLSTNESKKSFYARIAGSEQHDEFFQSPYTQRVLHPYIYRNRISFPPWLKLMCEVQYATTGVPPERASIDYCYVRPNHIAAINALLQTLFWPGIDMSDCLSYPDYSIVALYKQLIIGCGFLVPDVGFNEAYISFMAVRPGWQRSGIATFMLYHLTQTCLTKDITLNVSATNSAVMFYQKFGFKIEEIILNFYDKYLPLNSKHSRHALFLRLSR